MSHKRTAPIITKFFFQVGFEAEGEARRYFVHALMLRDTVRFLRYNKNLCSDMESGSAVDLIRCESLLSLEPSTRSRVLNKNYRSVLNKNYRSLLNKNYRSLLNKNYRSVLIKNYRSVLNKSYRSVIISIARKIKLQ